ncbi:hypothetical protein HHI_16856 [Hyphomonas hirschiana VP5]|uniref:Uncharacterized protein n=1 Tax=Hyphomonas hirschiana VP5 TaxID=1280951 RepID=A0A059F820_9PROT|nr:MULTISPECIES: hypothetical protein [Hyphomonas]KCZ86740.1 hypothetical protein HHI_16856 [Hyphomonas hirschiana VP5]
MKLRIILMAGGSVIGLAGAGALSWAAVVALAPWLGLAESGALVGGVLIAAGGLAIWNATRPAVPLEDEFAGVTAAATNTMTYIRDDTLDALTGMSLNVVGNMVSKRPLLTLVGVGVAAYAVTRAPNTSAGIVDRMLSRLI